MPFSDPEKRRAYARKHYENNRDKHLSRCSAYRQANSEKVRAWDRQWKKNNPEKIRAWKRNNPEKVRAQGLRRYGLSLTRYEEILSAQNGLCAICKIPAAKAFRKKLFVDHDHTTGGVRGLLCSQCNFVLGHSKESIEILQSAQKYLTEGVVYGS